MKDDGLAFKIATGIILAFIVIGGVRACQQRLALNELARQFEAINQQTAASMRRVSADAAHRQAVQRAQAAEQRSTEAAARALPLNHRCIGKDLFQRVENGWVQITDGSAKRICPR